MRVQAIKTRKLCPPQDDLFNAITKAIKKLPECSVVAISSKVVSIHQGRCIPLSDIKDKDKLIKKEADRYLPRNKVLRGYAVLTLKHGILIPSAGIDESNVGDYYVLWPNQPDKMAWQILKFLKKKYKKKKIGVIITDSHTVPMRRGVLGIALAYAGFQPLNDYRGTKDLFGRKFEVSTANVVDGLAVSAVLAMGEGTERTPLALITDIPFVKFLSRPYKPDKKHSSLKINWNEDLYGPLLRAVKWRRK